MRGRRGWATGAVAVAAALAGAGGAGAASTNELTCGGSTVGISVTGHGEFTAAQVGSGAGVFVPTSFAGFHGEIRDAQGVLVDTIDDPTVVIKGHGARDAKGDVQSCTFRIVEVGDGSDPSLPAGYTITGTGGVRGFFR